MKYLARRKIFHRHEREILVNAGAPLVLVFLIGKLQDCIGSFSKLFEKLLFLKFYIDLPVPKATILEIFGKK